VQPVGIFDSGVGGLSVLRAIRDELPHEDLIYVADSAYAPYGDKPESVIQDRARTIVQFLVTRCAKAIVVACNTATGVSADALRSQFSLPIVAVEPALKPAVERTKTGIVGVLATTRTQASRKFLKLMDAHGRGAKVLLQACPGLAEHVERAEQSTAPTRELIEAYVRPLTQQGADTLVLGCTHYPFLRDVLQDVAGPDVALIDPAEPVARELRRRLTAAALLAPADRQGREQFCTSGPIERVTPVIAQLWGDAVPVRQMEIDG